MNIRFFSSFCKTRRNTLIQKPITLGIGNYVSNGFGLDINCNIGETTKELQKKYPHLMFLGIEKDREKVEIAREKNKDYYFLNIDIENNKSELENKFEIIQISDYKDFWKILNISHSILEKDGILIMKYKENDILEVDKLLNKGKDGKFTHIYLSDENNKVFFLK